MIPHRLVAVGSDEFTRYDSDGEQWRSMALRAKSNRIYGDGYMIESHQGEKLLEWMKKIGLPAHAIQHQAEFTKKMLVSYRAMDLIFGHFQNKNYAYNYIENHLLPRNEGQFKEKFDREVLSGRSIEDLAREYSDYSFLKEQPQGTFDLASLDEVIKILRNHTIVGMQPEDAEGVFRDYFKTLPYFITSIFHTMIEL